MNNVHWMWKLVVCIWSDATARSPLVFLASVTLLWAPSAALGESGKVLIRAPIGCVAEQDNCKADISLAAASKSNDQLAARLAQCIAAKKKKQEEIEQKRKEAEGKRKPGELFSDSLVLEFLDPFETPCIITTDLTPGCNHDLPGAKSTEWASVEIIKNGIAEVQDLRARAASGELANGRIVVETLESKPDEQHLALCSVRAIKGAQGPPDNCTTVAIVTPTLTLLRAELIESWNFGCLTSATFRLSGAIDVTFEVQTQLDPTKFSDSIYRTLTEQLAFQSETDITKDDRGKITGISIRSSAPYRESPILKNGWRESIDFDVSIKVRDAGIDVWAFSRPMVSRAAAGQSIDYRGPDDAQKATYATVLDDYIGKAIKNACAKATQIDSKRIECQ